MSPAGLYVHIPFCQHKCGYCDFYSTVAGRQEMSDFVDALLIELEQVLATEPRSIRTIYVGGGTPTFLPTPLLARVMAVLGRLARTHPVVEFTVEANPGSLDEGKTDLLLAGGVNRISLGAQSFHADELRFLERVHTPDDIASAADLVHRRGFAHLNLDLIFGIPGQTPDSWRASLRRAVDLGPDHLACYGLTWEPGTPLEHRLRLGETRPVDEDLEAELFEIAAAFLTAEGFEHYEISNYARPGARCLHNLNYWYNGESIGVGPSAASYLNGRRQRNIPDTGAYVACLRDRRSPVIETEELPPLRRAGETAMLMLRLVEGMETARFRSITGCDAHALFAEAIARHRAAGLLEVTPETIRLTARGRLLANEVMADFLCPEALDRNTVPAP